VSPEQIITPPLLSKAQVTRLVRERMTTLLLDASGSEPGAAAIYTLSDPRDIREVRYVGQTRSPRRRFLQHVNCARLWLPDEVPWWVKKPELRPLYHWLRELHRDEHRLPIMVITAWYDSLAEARAAERASIYEHLGRQLPLLNVETEILDRQIPLI
jgi:hypothetical protein